MDAGILYVAADCRKKAKQNKAAVPVIGTAA